MEGDEKGIAAANTIRCTQVFLNGVYLKCSFIISFGSFLSVIFTSTICRCSSWFRGNMELKQYAGSYNSDKNNLRVRFSLYVYNPNRLPRGAYRIYTQI